MFYLRSGKSNEISYKRVLVWVCDDDNDITVCFGDFDSYDNTYSNELNGKHIENLSEIQAYVEDMPYAWDEPTWDVYDNQLRYVESREKL